MIHILIFIILKITMESQNMRETFIDTANSECNYSAKNTRSILNELSNYNIPDDIKSRANIIYNSMVSNIKRANKRKYLLFYCVYSAYKELNITVNPVELGKKFNLSPGDVQKTHSMFSPLQTNYKPVNRIINASDYISDFCKKLNMDSYESDIIMFTNNILNKNPSLTQEQPQTVAAGVLKYYMMINGIELIDKHQLSISTLRSDTTIDGMYKKISTMDNI
jgi:transcription initiation factor TFIIIB Brf1 subunit/transcription initiation factor TFIIB